MKRIMFAAAVLAIAACSGGEKAPEAAPPAAAPAAAPMDTGMKMDTTAKAADTTAPAKKAP